MLSARPRIAAIFAAAGMLAACGDATDPDKRHFACEFRGSPHKKTEHPNAHFDRVFYYKALDSDRYAENFAGDSAKARREGDVLYRAILKRAGRREGFHREEFEVYRFHLDTHVMVHSYVFHVTPADHRRNFQRDHPHSISGYVDIANQPHLFNLVDKAPPDEGYIKIGWDKSKWQCRPVSAAEYARHGFWGGAVQVLSD